MQHEQKYQEKIRQKEEEIEKIIREEQRCKSLLLLKEG